MKKLIGEELEKDKEFWGTGIWDEDDAEDFEAPGPAYCSW